jgi:hypothetical protein
MFDRDRESDESRRFLSFLRCYHHSYLVERCSFKKESLRYLTQNHAASILRGPVLVRVEQAYATDAVRISPFSPMVPFSAINYNEELPRQPAIVKQARCCPSERCPSPVGDPMIPSFHDIVAACDALCSDEAGGARNGAVRVCRERAGKRMDDLIHCECDHGMATHTDYGCQSQRLGRCGCRLTSRDVLDRALAAARVVDRLAAGSPASRKRSHRRQPVSGPRTSGLTTSGPAIDTQSSSSGAMQSAQATAKMPLGAGSRPAAP